MVEIIPCLLRSQRVTLAASPVAAVFNVLISPAATVLVTFVTVIFVHLPGGPAASRRGQRRSPVHVDRDR